MLPLLACGGVLLPPRQLPRRCRISSPALLADPGVIGYFACRDVSLVERRDEDVATFHAKECERWDVVYDDDYYARHPGGIVLDFYPGDRVEVVNDVALKGIESAKGMRGVVTHFEFDDGYESCQTCSTACPVKVLLDG